MRISDWSSDVCSSDLIDAPSWAAVTQVFHELVDAAKEWLADEKVQESQTRFVGSIEARYQGQNYEIAIPVDPLALPDMDEFLTHFGDAHQKRSEEHTSELQSLMRTSYAVFCLKKKKQIKHIDTTYTQPN